MVQETETYYSNEYLDSDDDIKDVKVLSHDDLQYDQEADDLDEKWMKKKSGDSVSNIFLCCPGCFSYLCYDCQQHEDYPEQFRAMFVTDQCKVDYGKRLVYSKDARSETSSAFIELPVQNYLEMDKAQDFFYPVNCSECATFLAVLDDDSVYHFFHVIAEHNENQQLEEKSDHSDDESM